MDVISRNISMVYKYSYRMILKVASAEAIILVDVGLGGVSSILLQEVNLPTLLISFREPELCWFL